MLQLRYCSIEWTDYGARVVFPSGKEVSAWPHPEDHNYHVIASRLGYGYDLMAYAREHELAHLIAAEEFGEGPSHVLEGLAHDAPLDHGKTLLEEMAAQTIQRLARANEYPILSGCDWSAVRSRFLSHVAELDREYAQRKAA